VLICSAVEDIEATGSALILQRLLQQQAMGATSMVTLLVELPADPTFGIAIDATGECGFLVALLSIGLSKSARCAAVLCTVASGDMAIVPMRLPVFALLSEQSFVDNLCGAIGEQTALTDAFADVGLVAARDLIYGDSLEFDVRGSLAILQSQAHDIFVRLKSGHRPNVSVTLAAQGARARCDRSIVHAAVSRNGLDLEFASAELQASKDVVLTAVTSDGRALRFASASLRQAPDVVLAAVRQNGHALRFAADDFVKRRDYCAPRLGAGSHSLGACI
jgi:hypothetical protein